MRFFVTTLLLTLTAAAQTNRGSLSGTVFDASQAVIAGAHVTLTTVGTNEVRKVTTSETGSYAFLSLEPVTYRIEVEADGFKRSVVENIKVDTASTASLNVTMENGRRGYQGLR